MADKFKLSIIAPDASFYEGEAEFLEFTSTEGQMGVYAQHIPLTTILEPCVMTIHNDGEKKKAAVIGGFIEILKEKVTVLAESAQWPEEIDLDHRVGRRFAQCGGSFLVTRHTTKRYGGPFLVTTLAISHIIKHN